MNKQKLHSSRKNHRSNSSIHSSIHSSVQSSIQSSIQIQCKSDVTGETSLVNDKDLKKYHDIYVKLNKLYNSNNVIYYITENDLDNIHNDKPEIHIKPTNEYDNKPIIKTHEKSYIKVHNSNSNKLDNKLNNTPEDLQHNIDALELILAELNDFDKFKTQKIKNYKVTSVTSDMKNGDTRHGSKKHKHRNHGHKNDEYKNDEYNVNDEHVNDEQITNLNKRNSEEEEHSIDIDSLVKKNIDYDINDTQEYDIFIITNENDRESYYGMPPKSVYSLGLVEKHFIGKVLDYKLNNGTNALFFIYSTQWPEYKFPIYVIIHNYKFTTKQFILIFNNIINLVT